jgi:O-antigen/teichoic acid export membrane protein
MNVAAGRGPSDEVGRNMLATAAGNLAIPASTVLTAPVLAQVLGVDGRGELAAVTALLILLTTAGTLGMPESLNHYLAAQRLRLGRGLLGALPVLLLAGAGAVALTLTLAPWVSDGDDELTHLTALTSIALVPTLAVAVLRGAASGLHRWKLVNREKYVNGAARAIGIFGLFATGELDVTTATVVMAAAPIVGGLAYLGIGQSAPSGEVDRVTVRGITGYGIRIWVGALTGILLVRLDQVLITPLSGVAALGLYAVAVNVSDVVLIGNSAIRDVTFSAESARASPDRLYKSARVSLLASLLVAGVIAATAPFWIPPVFGPEFRDAVPVTELLLLASLVGVPGSIAGAGLSARGRPGLRSTSLLIACAVNAIGVVLLVPPYGAMGAAVATLVGNFVSANLNILWCWRYFGLDPRQFYALRVSDAREVLAVVRGLLRRGR